MALIKCRACGEQVAEDAHTCPHCGAPEPKRKSMSYGKAVVLLILGTGFLLCVGMPMMTKVFTALLSDNVQEVQEAHEAQEAP